MCGLKWMSINFKRVLLYDMTQILIFRSVDEVKESLSILETRIDQLDSENSPFLSKSNIKYPKELSVCSFNSSNVEYILI